MSFEMLMLGCTTLLLIIGAIPEFVAKVHLYGLNWLVNYQNLSDLPALPEWGQRCVHAQADLRASYPAFAVAVLLLAFTGGFTPATALASALFLVARLLHMPADIAGFGWLRTFASGLSFLTTLYLLCIAMVALVSF